MSGMMIGGTDLIFSVRRADFDIRSVLEAILDLWPHAVFEEADGEGTQPLAEVCGRKVFPSEEFFISRDAAAAKSWDEQGATPENANDLVHILWGQPSGPAGQPQLTVVVGSLTDEMIRLRDAIHARTNEGPPPRP